MRGCLSVLVLAAIFVVAGAWFGGQLLAAGIVRSALDASSFEGRNTTVQVVADPPIEVLLGRADEVRVGSDDASLEGLAAVRLDVTLSGIDLVGRTFDHLAGTLDDVTIRGEDGGRTRATTVALAGPPDDVEAIVRIAPSAVDDLVAAAIEREIGFSVGSVSLRAPDTLVFSAGPLEATGRLVVEADGSLFLAAELPGNPRIAILDAGAPLVFDSVAIGEDLVLVGSLDLAEWLE
jgi:hypothetical protein